MKKRMNMIGIMSICMLSSASHATHSIFNIVPSSTTPIRLASTGSTVLTYTATNDTAKDVSNISIKPNYEITGNPLTINMQTNGCTGILKSKQSCTFSIFLQGTGQAADVILRPEMCGYNVERSPAMCSNPIESNRVPVLVSSASSIGTHMVAVGTYSLPPGNKIFGLSTVSDDSGKTWRLSTGLPPQKTDGTIQNNQIFDVACGYSGQHCVAIGSYQKNNGVNQFNLSYVSNDGGNNWVFSSSFPPDQGTANEINTVSCDNTGLKCVALGDFFTGGNLTLSSYISNDGGNTWTISAGQPITTTNSLLFGSACDSTGTKCVAGGFGYGGNNSPVFYVSNDGGNTWNVTAQPVGGAYQVNAIACDITGTICTAVASSDGGAIAALTYFSTDSGNTWTPSTTQPPQQTTNTDNLTDVSCDDTGMKCTSTGTTGNNIPISYVTTNGGKDWAISATQPPRFPTSTTNDQLNTVFCSYSANACSAGGFYPGGNSLFYTSSNYGNTWTVSTTLPPAPAGATSTDILAMSGVR